MTNSRVKVVVYPTSENPYQFLLYSSLLNLNKNLTVTYLTGSKYKHIGTVLLLSLPIKALYFRVLGYKIFHLHWPNFSFPYRYDFFKHLSYYYSISFIAFLKILGFRIIWTMHNIAPHDALTANDEEVTKTIIKMSDKVIIHSEDVVEIKNDDKGKFAVVPHGSYLNFYSSPISKKKARKLLGIKDSNFVFLSLGFIKKYKGIEKLVKDFSDLIVTYPEAILVIAGNCTDKTTVDFLYSYRKKLGNNLVLNLKYIPDAEISIYFSATDVTVFSFKKITTSGSILLALSYGSPIIYPNLGTLKSIPAGVGFRYKAEDEVALKKAMATAMDNRSDIFTKSGNALKFAKNNSWDKSAILTLEIYKNVKK